MIKIVNDKSSQKEDFYIKIINEFKQLNKKIDSIIRVDEQILGVQKEIYSLLIKSKGSNYSKEKKVVLDATTMLSLPGSLRKTMIALYNIGEGTAEDLSKETKRLRAVESNCANQLFRMGYVKKKRVGRRTYFYIKEPSREFK